MLKQKNVMVAGHRTSMRLEASMWDALVDIGRREGMTVNAIITRLSAGKPDNLSSAVRAWVADYYRAASTEAGHAAAGHGLGHPFPVPEERTEEANALPALSVGATGTA